MAQADFAIWLVFDKASQTQIVKNMSVPTLKHNMPEMNSGCCVATMFLRFCGVKEQ